MISKQSKILSKLDNEELIIYYLKTKGTLSPKTLKNYKVLLTQFFKFCYNKQMGMLKVNEIDISKFISQYQYKSTKDSYKTILNIFFKWCFKHRLVDHNPVEDITIKSGKKKKQELILDKEFKEILSRCEGLREMAIASMFWYSGIRAKELRGMKTEDIDLEKGLIHVTNSKTMTGYRIIPIHSNFKKLLSKYLDKRKTIINPLTELFLTKKGSSFSESTIIHLIANIQRDLDFSFSCHDFRRADARKLFCLFSILPEPTSLDQIRAIYREDEKNEILTLINILQGVSLISMSTGNKIHKSLFSMLPLTRIFAAQNLVNFRGLERNARQNLAEYFRLNDDTQKALQEYGLSVENVLGQTDRAVMASRVANLAFTRYQGGLYSEARNLFEQAIEINPRWAFTYQMYATMERQQGNYSRANALFEKASLLAPKNSQIFISWGLMKKDERNFVDAEVLFEKALSTISGKFLPIIYEHLAFVKMRLGKSHQLILQMKPLLIGEPATKREFQQNSLVVQILIEAMTNNAVSKSKKNKFKDAIILFEDCKELIEKNKNKINRTKYYYSKVSYFYSQFAFTQSRSRNYEHSDKLYVKAFELLPDLKGTINLRNKIAYNRVKNLVFWKKKNKAEELANLYLTKYKLTKILELEKEGIKLKFNLN